MFPSLRALSILTLGAAIASGGCAIKKSPRRTTVAPATAPTSYELPWSVGPVPDQPAAPLAAATPSASASTGAPSHSASSVPNPYGTGPNSATVDPRCADDGASLEDCRAAYRALAAAGQGERTLAVYERLCNKKEKLQGCGAFKSKAVGPGDRPTMALLAMCEAEQWEHCEDASTKVSALVAWRATLKTAGCKAGANALCSNYKECKGRAQWGCMAAAVGEVCGCIPRCEGTVLAKAAGERTWPDGKRRGQFECPAR
jgi:hypothetical protein